MILGTTVRLVVLSGMAAGQTITSFETEDEVKILGFTGVTVERVQEHATDGEWALKVLFPGSEEDTWPGIGWRPREMSADFQALEFDIYNPAAEAIRLSWRIDVEGRDAIFGGTSIQPRTTRAVEIWLAGLGKVTRVYPYIRMPREDVVLYFDDWRWFSLEGYFTPLHYVDDAAPPVPTDTEAARGFILFQRPFTDVVFANTVPREDERTASVDVFATPGEYEPASFSLYALQDLPQVRVRFDGIPATGEVLPVRCLDKRVVYSSREFVEGMPVLCERREAVDVPGGSSKTFVIDLHVNGDADPGIHEGRISIEPDGAEAVVLPLRLRVLPSVLAEPDGMSWGEYYTGAKLAEDEQQWSEFLARDMRDMREHGMTSVGLCFGPPNANVVYAEDGGCELNLDGTSQYEQFMDRYVELGFPAPVILLSDTGQGAASKDVELAVETDEWGNRYKAFWTAMQAEQRRRGWPEVIVQPIDEPGWQSRERKDRNVRCLKLLKEIPGMRTEQDGPGDDYFHNEAGPFADVWNYNGGLAERDVVAAAMANGKIIVLYNCDVESYRPEIDRYTAGWFQEASGTSGCFNWAYVSYNGSPYDDQDHKTGTWMHVYPPLGDEPGGPSKGWIGAREGVDDLKYVHTLEQAAARADASGNRAARRAARQARRDLEAIVESIDYSRRVRSQARWTETGIRADGAKTIGGTLKLPNGWEHSEYDKMRWKVARATLDVLQALGEVEPRPAGRVVEVWDGELLGDVRWRSEERAPEPEVVAGSDRQVTIPVWQSGPEVDGDLGDEAWEHAVRLDPFVLAAGKAKPKQQTDVLVGSDGRMLYVGATCHEDNIANITATVAEDGGEVWQDDCIEVFVDGNLDRASFRQVIVNSLGTQGWNDSTDPKWRAASVAKTQVGEKSWIVELAIPLADLGLRGTEFGLNVCRERRPTETLELSCWSPTGGLFGRPERFGTASLGQAWLGTLEVPPARLGLNEFRVVLKNETDETRRVAPELWTKREGRDERRELEEEPLELAAGAELARQYGYEFTTEEAPVMSLRLSDADRRDRILAERSFSPTVLPPLRVDVRPRLSYLSEGTIGAEFEVNLGGRLLRRSELTVALLGPKGKRVLRSVTVPVEGNRAVAAIDLGGLPEGAYRVRARLSSRGGNELAEATARIERLRGPFD